MWRRKQNQTGLKEEEGKKKKAQSHTLTSTTHTSNTYLIISCTRSFRCPPLHTHTNPFLCHVTVSGRTFSLSVRVCACVHTEPILLNPVPHWIPVSGLSIATSQNLPPASRRLVLAQGVTSGLGLTPIRFSDWSTSSCLIQASSFGRLL